jgi:uncharacterized protein involved in response to NO
MTSQSAVPALLQKGFRPFFLLAGLWACLAIPLWGLGYSGLSPLSAHPPAMHWHIHSMIFGYTVAVISGFLLTAVANWTGRETLTGWPLAAMALLWLVGQLSLWIAPGADFTSYLNLAFLPLLAAVLGRCIIGSKNKRNYFVLAILTLLWLAQLSSYRTLLPRPQYLALAMVWVLMTVIATRVLPFFSKTGTSNYQGRRIERLDQVTIACVVTFALGFSLQFKILTGATGIAAGILIISQLHYWWDPEVKYKPMLWILFNGYGWLGGGLIMMGTAVLTDSNSLSGAGMHLATVGGIGGLTLGMMSRVALGHTGRPLKADKLTIVAFATISLAALTRSIMPLLLPDNYLLWIQLSAALWALAALCWLVTVSPVLCQPRVDGKPG